MSLDAVAQAVGIRKASLYHHFPGGKDELFVAVVERRTAEDGERVSQAIAGLPDTFARLRAISHYFNSVAERRPYHALRDMAAHLPEQHRDWVLKLVDERVMAPVRAVIDEGMRRRELKRCDPELAALAFVTLMASMGKIAADDPRRARVVGFHRRRVRRRTAARLRGCRQSRRINATGVAVGSRPIEVVCWKRELTLAAVT